MTSEEAIIAQFKAKKCCQNSCFDTFTAKEFKQYCLECSEIDFCDELGNRLDLLILGVMRALMKTHDTITHVRSLSNKHDNEKK